MGEAMAMKSRIGRLVLVCVVFLLVQASALSVTPVGEGMDVYGHLAYLDFFATQQRAPTPDELSVADWIVGLQKDMPGPDFSMTAERYRRWAGLGLAERGTISDRNQPRPGPEPYVASNYESQQPPLYYAVLSPIYRLLRPAFPVETQLFVLGLVSACMAALALPGLYLTFRQSLEQTDSLFVMLALVWFPNFLPFLGRITNDALAFPLMVWAVYFCLRSRERRARGSLFAAGALISVAGFTKVYALALWPMLVACALWGTERRRWREAGLALMICGLGVGALVAYTFAATGHAFALREMVALESVPLLERLSWMFRLDPGAFLGGMVKGFWWSGYWSFVSSGLIYYAPLGLLPLLLLVPSRTAWAAAFRSVWPHAVAILSFIAAMAWHAANFALLASPQGQTVFSGNEGWYANVLVGSFAVIALVLLRARLAPPAFRRFLAATTVFLVVWNVFARVALGAFWMGIVDVEGRNRGVVWSQAFPAVLNPDSWRAWLSLPGVIEPVALTAALPLLVAIGLTVMVMRGRVESV